MSPGEKNHLWLRTTDLIQYVFYLFIHLPSSLLEYNFHENRNFCLCCSLLYCECPE